MNASPIRLIVIAALLAATAPGVGYADPASARGIVESVHEVPLAEVHGWLKARADAGALVAIKVYAGLYFCR